MNEYRKLMESIDSIDAKGSIFDDDQALSPVNPDSQPPAPQTDPMDLVTMDVPLLIRLFELMNETVESDADLHHIVTQILNVSKQSDGPLTMEHYNEILNGASDEPVHEGVFDIKVSPIEQACRIGIRSITESVSLFETLHQFVKSPVAEKQIEMLVSDLKDNRKILSTIKKTGRY